MCLCFNVRNKFVLYAFHEIRISRSVHETWGVLAIGMVTVKLVTDQCITKK